MLSSIYSDLVQDSLRQLQTSEFSYQYLNRFKVFYQVSKDAAETLESTERIFNEVCRDLGVPTDFLGDRLIKIFVCHDQSEYLRLIPHSREWQGGSASWQNLEIYTYPQKDIGRWLLPHEITHIVYGHYFKNDVLWLHEGIAQCEEARFVFKGYETAGYFGLKDHFAPLKKKYIPFEEFIDLHRIPSGSSDEFIELYYLQAFSFMYFLRQEYGEDRFRQFLKGIRRGAPIENALIESHGDEFNGLAQLESLWTIFYTWE